MTATPSPHPAPKHDPYAALREPNYRYFISGWVLASMGLQMQGAALLWEIYQKTGDALSLGYVSLARALPVILLALPAGQIVDLLDRKRVLIATQIAFAAASILLAVGSFHDVSVWWMYVLVSLTGCARVFNGPSRSSLLPQIVRPENFHNAVTWNSNMFQVSAISGPIVAGGLIALTAGRGMGTPDASGVAHGVAWPVYAITAATCVVFAFTCSFVRPRHRRQGMHGRIIDAIRPSVMLPGMLEGARYVWREKTVLGAIALDLMAVLLGGATALLPVYAKDILHVGPAGYGALKSAQYVGALVMTLHLAHRPPFRRAGRTLLLSVAGFGLFTICFGLATNFYVALAMLFILGALDGISVVIRHVLVSVRTPDRLRGRVSAVNSVFIESSNELGGFESGALAKIAGTWLGVVGGTVFSVVSGGVGTLLVVAGVAVWLPALRRLGALDLPKSEVEEAAEEEEAARSSV